MIRPVSYWDVIIETVYLAIVSIKSGYGNQSARAASCIVRSRLVAVVLCNWGFRLLYSRRSEFGSGFPSYKIGYSELRFYEATGCRLGECPC